MIVLSHRSAPAQRWLAHLVRASLACIRRGDRFDDDHPFDADHVLALARRQRVAPLLHGAAMEGRIADPLPEDFRDGCERTYYAALRKNLLALESGNEALGALHEMGVSAVPIKGWALLTGSEPLYADPGARPMDDLDLMVRTADRECAEAVLQEIGWRPVTPRAAALRGGHEMAFHKRLAGADLFIELHWAWAGSESLMRPFSVSGDRFIDGLCERDGDGCLRPTRTGHLLFSAVHAARHTLERWIWMVDLHRLVSCEPLDWSALLAQARQWRVRGPLYASLLATRQLLRTPVPREVLGALAPGPVRRRLLQRSLAASLRSGGRTRAARTAKLLLGESWWDVARTAAWAVMPGPAWYQARGESASPARRIAHPVRVLRGEPTRVRALPKPLAPAPAAPPTPGGVPQGVSLEVR